ncbi:GTP cyclohydrolase 1 feedback regulatory protein-like isoform X2 [Zootermopsis nevadensis]|uniref:GTP cyclohydrolase 1 feedback regulatory protein-like isoform X2 n=1 Tax=Zootermopsis nevadensis TaxID=136037 RepID=UPI000B8E945F|nr:GTP cyclohydrolase 1 feedback regulatory protein-like isoform X2 [Zootermopsis nevadensis]
MPYVLVTTQIRLERGPTIVGDEFSDTELMSYLGAVKKTEPGNNFAVYVAEHPPRLILNKLEVRGYKLVTTCSQCLPLD